jgi:hypothetical protein
MNVVAQPRTKSFNQTKLLGKWIQVYSNRYVQQTKEIGLKCISVELKALEGSDELHVFKTGYLHGNLSNKVNSEYVLTSTTRKPLNNSRVDINTTDDTVQLYYQSNLENDAPYQLREYDGDYNYLLWSQMDNSSIYVWARNVIDFKVNYDWRVLEKFSFWNFTGYYKFPVPSYSFQCMVRRSSEDNLSSPDEPNAKKDPEDILDDGDEDAILILP